MPIYDYYCPANGQTVEVNHTMDAELTIWGEVCYVAQIPLGDTDPMSPVRRVITKAPSITTNPGNAELKNLGFKKFVRRDAGVFENVTAANASERYLVSDDNDPLPKFTADPDDFESIENRTMSNPELLNELAYNADGLIPAIAQQHDTGEVLMMAWMNRDSLAESLRTGHVCYWSRSRQQYWRKGETSGHVQRLVEARYDCDSDALLLFVDQTGPACHTNRRSCFFNSLGGPETDPDDGIASDG